MILNHVTTRARIWIKRTNFPPSALNPEVKTHPIFGKCVSQFTFTSFPRLIRLLAVMLNPSSTGGAIAASTFAFTRWKIEDEDEEGFILAATLFCASNWCTFSRSDLMSANASLVRRLRLEISSSSSSSSSTEEEEDPASRLNTISLACVCRVVVSLLRAGGR